MITPEQNGSATFRMIKALRKEDILMLPNKPDKARIALIKYAEQFERGVR